MKMKKNADWLVKRSAWKRCHSEPKSTSGRAEDKLVMSNVWGDQVPGSEAIFGFSKCGTISNFQKSRLYAAGDVV